MMTAILSPAAKYIVVPAYYRALAEAAEKDEIPYFVFIFLK
jgi:hypothetical protein